MTSANGTTDMSAETGRELSDEAVRHEAEQLAAYVARGGNASRWLDSKDLLPGDRARVLLALGDLEDELVLEDAGEGAA